MRGWTTIEVRDDVLARLRAELDRLEPHEHGESQNECLVCEENIVEAALRHLKRAPGPTPPAQASLELQLRTPRADGKPMDGCRWPGCIRDSMRRSEFCAEHDWYMKQKEKER